MEPRTEPYVVGVRFSKVGKVYHFSTSNEMDIKVGDQVVVETSRGWQLGQVAQILEDADPPPDGWKEIDRRATPRDLLLRQMWQMKEAEVVSTCRAKAVELKLSGIKIVSAEYSFDGARLVILFSTETEEKYDLKSLRQDMQKIYGPSQVEMRQIGPRDMAKVTCGMGACGLETRCCCLFLTEFSSISIRMAKEQGISLTPSEITGMCGRLRCCLIYEYDTYVDARTKLPKRNKRVYTPQGEGKVVDIIPLRGAVVVELAEGGRREYRGDEVSLVEDGKPQGSQQIIRSKGPLETSWAVGGETGDDDSLLVDEKPAQAAQRNMPITRVSRTGMSQDLAPSVLEGGQPRQEQHGRNRQSGVRSPKKTGQSNETASGRPQQGSSSGIAKKKDRKPSRPPGGPDKTKGRTDSSNQSRKGRDSNRKKGRQRDNLPES